MSVTHFMHSQEMAAVEAALQGRGVVFGQSVRWTTLDGSVADVHTTGHTTMDAAQETGFRMATRMGWTPIRWWKFWRWGDTPNPPQGVITSTDVSAPSELQATKRPPVA